LKRPGKIGWLDAKEISLTKVVEENHLLETPSIELENRLEEQKLLLLKAFTDEPRISPGGLWDLVLYDLELLLKKA
jgi:hypothetical protein